MIYADSFWLLFGSFSQFDRCPKGGGLEARIKTEKLSAPMGTITHKEEVEMQKRADLEPLIIQEWLKRPNIQRTEMDVLNK